MDFYFNQKKLHDNAKLIQRNPDDPEAAGYDIFAPEGGFIDPLQRKRIALGFAAEFTPGYVALLLDRSGMGNKGITRFAGVIDSSWRGEWQVILYNSNAQKFEWNPGDKLIQAVFVQYGTMQVGWVDSLSETSRGEKGFGSSGGVGKVIEVGINQATIVQKFEPQQSTKPSKGGLPKHHETGDPVG